jgi:transcriptional regulator with XRE-family HTH domain
MFPMVDSMDFVEWLEEEMRQRKLSQAELARRGEISRSAINKLLNRQQKKPGIVMLEAIARGLDMPPSEIFRISGFGGQVTEKESLKDELDYLTQSMSESELIEIIKYVRYRKEEKQANTKKSSRSIRPARTAS